MGNKKKLMFQLNLHVYTNSLFCLLDVGFSMNYSEAPEEECLSLGVVVI